MADNEDNNPNADMSMRDQFAQYAYGRAVANALNDPDRDASELTTAAARAGMDVVFGESHDVMGETLLQIQTLVQSLPADHIQAVSLELPVEMQELFDPTVISSISRSEFIGRMFELEGQSVVDSAQSMLERGAITQEQFEYIKDFIEPIYDQISNRIDQNPSRFDDSNFSKIYDLATITAEIGVPLIAADLGRERIAAAVLDQAIDWNIPLRPDEHSAIFHSELDDRSDVEYLQGLGVDLSQSGIIIAHRGYGHINNTTEYSIRNSDLEPTEGFDEVLEVAGRQVVTFAVLSEFGRINIVDDVDPADFCICLDEFNQIKLSHGEDIERPPTLDEYMRGNLHNYNGDDIEDIGPNKSIRNHQPVDDVLPQTPLHENEGEHKHETNTPAPWWSPNGSTLG